MLQQDVDVDEDEGSESEEEEFTGTWDDNCKLVAYDMQTKKALADQFASERIAELLKKNSKYLHAMAPTGKQFLHWASYGGCELTCKLLLSRGAKKDAEDIWKKTAYDYAIQSGQPETLLAILRPK